MLLLVADENFNNTIVRGLLRLKPSLDIVRIQDVGLSSADDPAVLEWAINDILLMAEACKNGELENQIIYLPL